MTRDARPARPRAGRVGLVLAGCLAAACAPPAPLLPADAGVPFPGYSQAHAEASAACAPVRTFTAEIALSGRVGGETVRGRVLSGFEQPASLRLIGVAPFGPPAFILAARGDAAVLLLPRDRRVLRGASAADVLDAITGVDLAPGDLQATLTGCVTADPRPLGGRLHRNGWVAIDLAGGVTVYLARQGEAWRPRAARREGWTIEYPPFEGTFPSEVVLRSTRDAIELTARISQLEANAAIDPEAFTVEVPDGTQPISLAELRAAGPLRAGDAP